MLVELTIVSVVFNVTGFSYFTMVNARHRIGNGGGIKAKFTIVRDGPLEKLWVGGGGGWWGIFQPQEHFSLSNSLYEFF